MFTDGERMFHIGEHIFRNGKRTFTDGEYKIYQDIIKIMSARALPSDRHNYITQQPRHKQNGGRTTQWQFSLHLL